jgi:hypothetical protein
MEVQVTSIKKKNSPTIVRAILLICFIVVFPLLSWLYLKGGINFRKEALAELVVKGSMSGYELKNTFGESVFTDDAIKVFSILRFTSYDSNALDNYQAYYDQFISTGNISFIIVTDSETVIDHPISSKVIQCIDSEPENKTFLNQVSELISISSSNYIVVLDREKQIRNVYDPADKESMSALVTHSAVMIPPKSDRELEFKRKREL